MGYYYDDNAGGGRRFLANVPDVTRNIIIINIIVFAATWLSESVMHSYVLTGTFALYYPGSRFFRIWQPLTYMFLHGGFFHILFNMYTLYIFGSVVERIIGEKKFLIFYILCGLGAAATQIGVQALEGGSGIPTVGASGAIYGLLIAYAMLFPDNRLTLIFPPVSLKSKWMVVIFAVVELLFSISGSSDGVAHVAHLGGMLFGWILIKYWRSAGTLFDREDL